MPGRRIVKLLATGGTIATRLDPASGRTAARDSGLDLARQLRPPDDVEIQVEEVLATPSWAMGPLEMQRVALAARDAAREARNSGVIVSHGTTTLEYTSFMADLFLDAPAPVVFTGAMRRADAPQPDGGSNLADALCVALDPASRQRGVLVVFAGRVLAARGAWKLRRTDVDAFIGLQGEAGAVDAGRVAFPPAAPRPVAFSGAVDEAVAIVKAYPGMTATGLTGLLTPSTHGLVIEGLPGSGGIPGGLQPALAGAVRLGFPTVISSRAPSGRVPSPPTGGTGEPLRGLDLLSAGWLSTEQAWVLLTVALGEGLRGAELRERFEAIALSGEGG